jgi:hypothetical protein
MQRYCARILISVHLKKTGKFLIVLLLLILTCDSSAQHGVRINRLLDEIGRTAYSYFLYANRPGFGVDAYFTDKSETFLSTGLYYSDGRFEIPLSISYGITDKLEVSAGISPFTQEYTFSGSKSSGLGDSYLGVKYRIQESEYFTHAIQTTIKIPTGSEQKEIGTGKFDFHFGAAQLFYYENLGFDLGLELNFLQRRDYPTNRKFQPYFQNAIDSIASAYDYSFEPEFVASGGPTFQFSDAFFVYTGYSFTRNFKLDFSSNMLYGGIGLSTSDNTGIGLGGSYSTDDLKSWSISSNFYFTF